MSFKSLFKHWRIWFKKQFWSLKWFLWLILLMPILSMFYDLKGEGLLSPLQIAGIFSFFISLLIIISKRVKLLEYEKFFLVFSILYTINHLFFFIENISISNFGYVLRNLLPTLLYFYFRRVIKSKRDFEGILLTFLVASIIPYSIYLYEFFINPIKQVYTSEGRGGFLRLTGFYADLFSYMAYIMGDFIIISYFIIQRKIKFKSYQIILLFGVTFIGVSGLSHQSSWGVFLTIVLLVLYFMKRVQLLKKILPFLLICIIFGGTFFIKKYIEPLFSKEINIYKGDTEKEKALNGRIFRWEKYYNIWKDMSIFNKFLGVGSSGSKHVKNMMSGGMHSDYIRLGFATGILGLTSYLLFYFSLLYRRRKFRKPISFIVLSSIVIMLLYAITANPFGSSGSLIYLTLATFSYVANKKLYGYN